MLISFDALLSIFVDSVPTDIEHCEHAHRLLDLLVDAGDVEVLRLRVLDHLH